MIINDEDSAHCYCLTERPAPAGRLWLTHLAGDRDAHGNHSTLALSPYDVKRAADELGALSHPQQAECALARLLIFCDAPSVVADRQDEIAVRLLNRNVNPRRLRMPEDVGQRFLKDAQDGRGLRLI